MMPHLADVEDLVEQVQLLHRAIFHLLDLLGLLERKPRLQHDV
jgi:hypothetical protein